MARKSRKQAVDQTKVVTTAEGVRKETPKSDRKNKPSVSVIVNPEINPVTGFIDFLRDHAVLGVAIGFVIGTQAQALVKQLVSSFIEPMLQLLFGQSLNQRTFSLEWHGRTVNFTWGAFGYAILNFVFVLVAIYVIIKFLNLEKFEKPEKKGEL